MKRVVFAVFGLICFGLGTVGVFLPILPTTPFYLLTLFFLANSSEKLHTWFIGTKLYKKHLDPLHHSGSRVALSYFLFCFPCKNDHKRRAGRNLQYPAGSCLTRKANHVNIRLVLTNQKMECMYAER